MIAVMKRDYWNKHSGKFAFVYSIFLVVVFVMPSPKVETLSPESHIDKVVHVTLFALYYFICFLALGCQKYGVVKATTISWSFALFTEMLQWFIPYRSADFHDVLADSAGILVGLIMSKVLFVRRRVGST